MNEQGNPFEGFAPSNVFGSAPESVDPEDIFGDPWPDISTEFQEPEADPTPAVELKVVPAVAMPVERTTLVTTSTPMKAAASPVALEPASSPLDAALDQQAQKEAQSIFSLPPVFDYGGVKEDILDSNQTFEELRIAKSEDFPELDDVKRVSWTVTYGSKVKTIASPKSERIGEIKKEIEMDKAFLDALKKAKDKAPRCLVKPTVRAQNKGLLAEYKGFFSTLEEARASDKIICLIPGPDGLLFERRSTELGEFITPIGKGDWDIRAGFTPALPPVPAVLLDESVGFFRALMTREYEENLEALVNLYWDRQEHCYCLHVPRQTVTHVSVHTDMEDAPDAERYLHYADIHSHNIMPAKFSVVDDKDEKATRIYIVIGHLDWLYPEVTARISNGGQFLEIPPQLIFAPEETVYFDPGWLECVESGPCWKSGEYA